MNNLYYTRDDPSDDSVRVDLCPKEYKFVDHHRNGRCIGGPGLLYKDSLMVITLYRPPYLDNHTQGSHEQVFH